MSRFIRSIWAGSSCRTTFAGEPITSDPSRTTPALQAWQRVLDIYPMMRSAQAEVATLSEELAGEAI